MKRTPIEVIEPKQGSTGIFSFTEIEDGFAGGKGYSGGPIVRIPKGDGQPVIAWIVAGHTDSSEGIGVLILFQRFAKDLNFSYCKKGG